jgi:hypothetical protein
MYSFPSYIHTSNVNVGSSNIDIKLIDLCDYYVFTKVSPEKYLNEGTLNYALGLYNHLDISATVIDISINVTENVYQQITNMFGKYIRIENNINETDIIRDIYSFLDYDNLLKKWDNIKKNSIIQEDIKSLEIKKSSFDPCDYIMGKDLQAHLPIKNDIQQTPNVESFNEIIGSYSYLSDDVLNSSSKFYILYNKLFNMSLIVSDSEEIIQHLCLQFPEFEVVLSFSTNDDNLISISNNYFDKRMYESKKDIIEKAQAFTTLYELNRKNTAGEKTEREEVYNILDNYFIVNNDPKFKIKAIDLYSRVTNYLSSNIDKIKSQTQLQKRLSSYFMEKGLTRKRYTDGIYYYGIQDIKENIKSIPTKNLIWNLDTTRGQLPSLKDIEKQRDNDIKKMNEEKELKIINEFKRITSVNTTTNGRGTLDLRQLNAFDKEDINIPVPEEQPFYNAPSIVSPQELLPFVTVSDFLNVNPDASVSYFS